MRARDICLKVFHQVQLLSIVSTPKRPSASLQQITLDTMGISKKQVTMRRDIWCKWGTSLQDGLNLMSMARLEKASVQEEG